jgi:hypothetical protein
LLVLEVQVGEYEIALKAENLDCIDFDHRDIDVEGLPDPDGVAQKRLNERVGHMFRRNERMAAKPWQSDVSFGVSAARRLRTHRVRECQVRQSNEDEGPRGRHPR